MKDGWKEWKIKLTNEHGVPGQPDRNRYVPDLLLVQIPYRGVKEEKESVVMGISVG